MARDFNLFGAAPANADALLQLFGAAMASANASANTRANAYGQGAQMALGGLNEGLNRGAQVREAAAQRALQELLAGKEQSAAMDRLKSELASRVSEGALERGTQESIAGAAQAAENQRAALARQSEEARARLSAMGEVGAQGVEHQGLDARAVMKILGAAAAQSQAAPRAPAAFDPFGPPDAGIMRLGVGTGLGMPPGAPQQPVSSSNDPFAGIPVIPPPPTVEAQRFAREQQTDQETMQAIAEATQFANSSQGLKMLYHPVKRSRLDAMGLSGADPETIDEEIISAFPDVKPTPGIDGKEDRTKLDRKLKWLDKEEEVLVPNEAGFLQGRQFLASRVSSPKALQAAMEAIAPHTDMRPARTLKDAIQVADEHLLKQMVVRKSATYPAQLQGSADLLKALQGIQEAKVASGPPMPGVWNKALIEQMGLNYTQLPRQLQDAAVLGYGIAPDKNGRIVFQPSPDGTPAPPSYQQALDKALANPAVKERLPAIMATGTEVQQSPTEVKNAATVRQMQKAVPAAPEPKPPPSKSPGMSALDEYRAEKEGKKAAPPAKRWQKGVPPQLDLIGRDPTALLRLLAGAGGPR